MFSYEVEHKQEHCLLYLLGQIVTWQSKTFSIRFKLTMLCYKWSWLTVYYKAPQFYFHSYLETYRQGQIRMPPTPPQVVVVGGGDKCLNLLVWDV